jgi:hypothetical protein
MWSKVLCHFECSQGYWVGCRLCFNNVSSRLAANTAHGIPFNRRQMGPPPLTLPRLASWRQHCGRTSASTRQSIRERKRWRRWGGRCASEKKQLPRLRSSMSKPRAISSNSSAMPSIEVVETRHHMMSPSMDCWSSRKLLGWGRVYGSYGSCSAGGIAGRGAGGARRTQC